MGVRMVEGGRMAGEQRTDRPTGLTISFVESIDDAIDAVVDHLNDGASERGLLDIDHVIVPNAGVRAWLMQSLSTRIGVSSRGGDGIAAGLSVRYIGELDRLIGRPGMVDDPWAVGPLAITLLSVIDRADATWAAPVGRMGGGLRAARLMADRFDRYHARRPSMICEWEDNVPALARQHVAESGDPLRDTAAPALDPDDRWQFDLWREARARIPVEPWPVRLRAVKENGEELGALALPDRLLVLGHQSLSVHHIELLKVLSTRMDITVIMQHPSPELARKWATDGTVTVTPGVAPLGGRAVVDSEVDELVGMWLRGSRDAQILLRSQGLSVVVPDRSPDLVPANLLEAVRHSIRTGRTARFTHVPGDPSLGFHRAHNLARQVEIVHDALLRAFHDDPTLRPHEVAVLCADIAAASPLLSATFDRTVETSGGPRRIPLIVADRGLREIDEGARLLADLVVAVTGRYSVGDVMSVATNELVRKHFAVTSDDVGAWTRVVDRGRVRWGLSGAQRDSSDTGLDLDFDAHTWGIALGRALAGAMLPDSSARIDFGGLVPMPGLEPSDIDSVSKLLAVVGVLSRLHERIHSEPQQTVVGWADILESSLADLAGPDAADIDDARSFLDTLRAHVSSAQGVDASTSTVSFAHFAEQLQEQISSNPGRQSMRTGSVVATSLVPLRGVPFKVVCLVGFDEGSLSAGEAEGDDLFARQQFVGDPDPRLEDRRAILDAICAASSRVIVTCNGRSIKNNEKVPLITPLAELVDLCERCGAAKVNKKSTIEYMHPRHSTGRSNFEKGGIVPGIVWSHDRAALRAVDGQTDRESGAAKLARTAEERIKRATTASPGVANSDTEISIGNLEWFLKDPLDAFVSGGLAIRTSTSGEPEVPATIPLDLDDGAFHALCGSRAAAHRAGMTFDEWTSIIEQTGEVPPGKYGKAIANRVKSRFDEYLRIAQAWNFVDSEPTTINVDLTTAGVRLKGAIHCRRSADGRLVFDCFDQHHSRYLDKDHAALLLLIARATGDPAEGALVCIIDEVTEDKVKVERTVANEVVFADTVDGDEALRRISVILGLYAEARATPMPKFGDAGKSAVLVKKKDDEADRAARKAFANCLAGPRGNKNSSFARTKECLVYGPLPTFDSIFSMGGPTVRFLDRYFKSALKADDGARKEAGLIRDTAPPSVPTDGSPLKARRRHYYP